MAVNGAGRINFVAEKGTKWSALISSWTYKATPAATATVVAPSDYSAASLVVYNADGTAAVTLTHSSGITLGATTIQLSMTPTQTNSLAVGTYEYQMTLTGGDTYPFEFLRGVFTVEDVPS